MRNAERRTIRLLIANEHLVICEGLRAMLIGKPEIELVGCATSIQETMRLVGEIEPDVLLIDPHSHNQEGLRAIRLIHGEWPQVAIIAFAMYEQEDHILQALRAGVRAYLPLHTERLTLYHAICAAVEGQVLLQPEHIARLLASVNAPVTTNGEIVATDEKDKGQKEEIKLTERECEILQGVAHGERNKEIAARLGISEPTVKSHLVNIYFKLNVDSRASAVAVAIQRGILSLQRSQL